VSVQDELMQAGFTEYEARVYLALLREHPTTGYQLSKNSGVPRSMVYEALGRLHARGAVLRTDVARATLYQPVPPAQLLDRYEAEHHHLMQQLRDGLSALYQPQERGHLWSISGRSAVLAYAEQMIRNASGELLLMLGDRDLDALRDHITQASERGIVVGALLTGTCVLEVGQVARHPPLESQLQELTSALVVIADSKEALIASTDPDVEATITSNPNLVLIARQFVWMELFTQRIAAQLGTDLLQALAPEDRQVFEGFLGTAQ
jgi:sugar-specific transcriptional regulator TrmB